MTPTEYKEYLNNQIDFHKNAAMYTANCGQAELSAWNWAQVGGFINARITFDNVKWG